jgi:predicted RNase H-like HicB family nuclease
MYEAIQLHLEGLLEDGLPVPASSSFAEYVVLEEPTRRRASA